MNNIDPILRTLVWRFILGRQTKKEAVGKLPSAFCPCALCWDEKDCLGSRVNCHIDDIPVLYSLERLQALIQKLSKSNEQMMNKSIGIVGDTKAQNALLSKSILSNEVSNSIVLFILNNMDSILSKEEEYELIGVERKEYAPKDFEAETIDNRYVDDVDMELPIEPKSKDYDKYHIFEDGTDSPMF